MMHATIGTIYKEVGFSMSNRPGQSLHQKPFLIRDMSMAITVQSTLDVLVPPPALVVHVCDRLP
jgi:hypothetical protein